MHFRTETRSIAAIYITLYLCLLAPLHLLHLNAGSQSFDQFDQTCTNECRQTPHNAGSCPTCQIGTGLIDLPIHFDLSSELAPVSTVRECIAPSVSPWESSRPSPRSPPCCG